LSIFHAIATRTRSRRGISFGGFVDWPWRLKSAEQLQGKITYHAVRNLEFAHTSLYSQNCRVSRNFFWKKDTTLISYILFDMVLVTWMCR